ncbi:hypothetical protein TYRP_017392 [Tyrophagus putrescentiae]|nr:hypothetical protein TYRP_017392 [Tyrophagus putrescentiae]
MNSENQKPKFQSVGSASCRQRTAMMMEQKSLAQLVPMAAPSQMSTEKSSLWRAGKSRCGAERLNRPSASMCSRESSLRAGVLLSRMSTTVTSPLRKAGWVLPSSSRSALSRAWFRR